MEKAQSTPMQTPPQVEWNLPEGIEKFSEKHLYHAYRTGFSEGEEQDVKLFEKQIQDNSRKAALDTLAVTTALEQLGITPISAHLKILSRYAMKVLITVSNEDFVKESFIDSYNRVNETQDKSRTDLYSIIFTFINRSAEFDIDLVRLDGYVSSYRPLEKN
ncbi:hypothetical protein SAMN04488109_1937 [Chryseolinea serpens]|uniref:Uncharacterized protein n=1 Tax=Chryseolinea serpens TaxID=947013 RepID=A0A1M5MTZ8_9BACT|nr:hypothetical protein [Chryseolinea serpens]SHG80768.1 hypothetical protein SAMN04488109_1937 [Chryseolinea serpens]